LLFPRACYFQQELSVPFRVRIPNHAISDKKFGKHTIRDKNFETRAFAEKLQNDSVSGNNFKPYSSEWPNGRLFNRVSGTDMSPKNGIHNLAGLKNALPPDAAAQSSPGNLPGHEGKGAAS